MTDKPSLRKLLPDAVAESAMYGPTAVAIALVAIWRWVRRHRDAT